MPLSLNERGRRCFESLIQVNVRQELFWKGKRWFLRIEPLALPGTITSILGLTEFPTGTNSPSLDWHDILNNPTEARMLAYVGAEKRVPFETKLERMQTWAETIEIYDSLMVDGITRLSKTEAETMLSKCQFPRLETVVLDTGTKGLIRLFSDFGFRVRNEPPYPFTPKWQEFVDLAKSGKFVGRWRELKRR